MKVDVMGTDAVWLPTDIEERELDGFLENDNYCLQKKEDGVHVLASHTADGRIDVRNRRGELHRIPPALERVLRQVPRETMLDGEKLHEGGLVVFDMLYGAGEDLRGFPYTGRLARAAELCLEVNSPLLRVVETALTPPAKRALADRLRAERAEGLILKDLRAPYRPGRTAWGWTMRRLKFLKSLTAIVQRPATGTKAHFEMFLIDQGKVVSIGTVSAQQFYDRLIPGQSVIAEVSYLYATPGNRVVQPRLKRPNPFRTDKAPEDCTIDQLVTGGRFA